MSFTLAPRVFTAALLAAALLPFSASTSSAQTTGHDEKLDAVLRHHAQRLSGRTRVIVQFTGETDIRVFGRRASTGRRLGPDAHVAEVENFDLTTLAADPRVARVMFDRPAFATLERTGLATGATVARQESGVSGRGVGIALIDSGISSWHDDLYRSSNSRAPEPVAHFKDFTTEANSQIWSSSPAYDDFGHGTHVAGILAGSGHDSGGKHKGMAPGATLVGLKVLDAEGRGYISDVIAAIDYAVSVRAAYNIRVINLSVASGVFESYWHDPLTLAARRAVDAGIVVVAAAGNLGLNDQNEVQFGGITSPGNAPWVLTVGAASHQGTSKRSDDIVGAFSSRGPTWIDFAAKPDLIAPGVGIVSLADPQSTLYASLPHLLLDGTADLPYRPYLSLSGTSMAAPVVAGTVALMLEVNPRLTPNSVKAILQYTAQVRPDITPLAQGAGMLNTLGAVRLAEFFGAPTEAVGAMGDTIEGEWVDWARHLIWGNYRITGGVPLPGSNAWALSTRWGAFETKLGTPVVWGARTTNNIVWSTAARNNIVWSTAARDNIVWSTAARDNIVWSTATRDNIVWSTAARDNIVWSTAARDNIVWSTAARDNIVWSTAARDNIVWSTAARNNIVWSTAARNNIVWSTVCGGEDCQQVVWGAEYDGTLWGTADARSNIVWSTAARDNIVWSTAARNNIVWSTATRDNIVWSTTAVDHVLWAEQ